MRNICVHFFFFQIKDIKHGEELKAFCISLRKLSRTVITRHDVVAVPSTLTPLGTELLMRDVEKTFRMSASCLRGAEVNPSTTSPPSAGRRSQLITHIRL